MLNLDPAKLLVIFVLVLVVMGPDKLPKYAGDMARLWRTFTNFRAQAEEEMRKIVPDLDLPRIPKSPSTALSGYVADLMSPTPISCAEGTDHEHDDRSRLVRANDSGADESTLGDSDTGFKAMPSMEVALDD